MKLCEDTPGISCEAAAKVVEAAVQYATSRDLKINVAVVD